MPTYLLPDRVPWFVVGPLIGLVVAGVFAVNNRAFGISGGYVQALALWRGRATEPWRVWSLVGLLAGALLASLLRGGPAPNLSYGALGQALPLAGIVPVLLAAGVAMGYGARWAGGCTSGHGLCGSAILSRASFAATGTFMATAIAVTLALHALTGGGL
ncbi:MAG TPA: YeeE/YedE thiosulfate transporter family protein [Chloroflexota bacterium]|jgi:uncharacterized membrane protein YedE/YeeE|nr:YeeE/YedE thiosulfate transporter family protein [Chloroflexota bacterium]